MNVSRRTRARVNRQERVAENEKEGRCWCRRSLSVLLEFLIKFHFWQSLKMNRPGVTKIVRCLSSICRVFLMFDSVGKVTLYTFVNCQVYIIIFETMSTT